MKYKSRAGEPASDHIWGLVCGFPAPHRQKRLLLAFQAYIDDSYDDEHFILAGYIAPAEKWAEFSDEWAELLSMRSPHYLSLDEFKMSEMRMSPERLEQASWFYRVIEKHVTAAVSCVVYTKEQENVLREFKWPPEVKETDRLSNPFYFAFRAIINCLAQHQHKLEIDEPIDFIFDESSEKKRVLDAWDWYVDGLPPETKKLTGDTPIFRSSDKVMPLQAADLYANWNRDWMNDKGEAGIENLDFPWEVKRDIPRLLMIFREKDFKIELDRSLVSHVQNRLDRFWSYPGTS